MRLYTQAECETWLTGRQRQKPDVTSGAHVERFTYPPTPGRIRYLAHWTATSITSRKPALLWITEWGI